MQYKDFNPREKWLIDNVCGKKIANIGFIGKARRGIELHNQFIERNINSEIFGIDIDKEKVKQFNIKNTFVADVRKLPVNKNEYDAIVMGEILEHFYEINSVIKEISRVTKSKGKLFITTPNTYELFRFLKHWFFISSYKTKCKQNYRQYLADEDHKTFWEPMSLFNLLNFNSFKINSVVTKHFNVPYIKSLRTLDLQFWPFNKLGEYLCIIAEKK